jgi:hypothetical protein
VVTDDEVRGHGPDVAAFTHDLNNALVAIRGYAELIGWEAEPGTDVRGYALEIVELCEHAADATRRLAELQSVGIGEPIRTTVPRARDRDAA